MKKKSYFRVVMMLSLALAITILLWVVSPVILVNAQGGYGGGGGGGGGGTTAPYRGVTVLTYVIDTEGVFGQDTIAESFDGQAQLMITAGTTFLSESGTLLYGITMLAQNSPPPPPTGSAFVSTVYAFGPDGGIFNPPATLVVNYDPNLLPEGASAESLSLAWFDAANNSWVLLDSIVDLVAHTVTSDQVIHFTDFAILVDTTPAAFSVADLAITPEVVGIGEEVSIKALVTNSGSLTGSHEVTLAINDINNNVEVTTKEVTLTGRTSQEVTFTVVRDVAGIYAINFDGLAGTFEVGVAAPSAPPSSIPPAPAPAPAPQPSPVAGINWYLIGGVVAAGIIVIGVLVRRAIRR